VNCACVGEIITINVSVSFSASILVLAVLKILKNLAERKGYI
jgi:hypothetical protein